VPNPTYELVPGMYAAVKIPLRSVQGVLTVPVQAVQATGNGQGVVLFVGGGNKLERRDVKVGLQTAEDAEILSGLQEGDTVVFGEQGQFREGQIVTPKFVNAPGGE
jgi:multidrug efflux pump subunit AcrA (membrane-fusion protein)